jgi:glutaconate CoA-transferase subunit B
VTSFGHGSGTGDRERLGLRGAGPTLVVTDLGLLRPDPETSELTLTELHPGIELAQVRQATGWQLKVAKDLAGTPEPTETELHILRELKKASE